jgi:cytochrome b561
MLRKFLASTFLLAIITNTAFAELTLNELGFKKENIKVDSKTVKMMDARNKKLQFHQKMGLATMAAMTATLLLAGEAENEGGTAQSYNSNNAHKYAGIATGLMYWTTAYYSLSAPKPDDMKDTGSTKIHKTLAWVHAPLMALVPVLGYLHDQDNKKGKASTGLVAAHGGLATIAYAAFMAAGLTMYFDF